jgi:hypothetical protein
MKNATLKFIVEVEPSVPKDETKSTIKADLEWALRELGLKGKVKHLNARSAQKIAREYS